MGFVCRVLMGDEGPMMTAGEEIAEAASQGLGTNMEFENISEYGFLPIPLLLSSSTSLFSLLMANDS
jgi:hypothetical protein